MSQDPKKAEATASPRLPCRGCLPSCANYDRCEGKPWRMPTTDKA